MVWLLGFQMLWGRAAPELSEADRVQFERLWRRGFPDFFADKPGYYAFITYTFFSGPFQTEMTFLNLII